MSADWSCRHSVSRLYDEIFVLKKENDLLLQVLLDTLPNDKRAALIDARNEIISLRESVQANYDDEPDC